MFFFLTVWVDYLENVEACSVELQWKLSPQDFGSALLFPSAQHMLYKPSPAATQSKQQKAQSQFQMCLSQYFQPPKFTQQQSKGERWRRRAQGEMESQRSVFVFLGRWCVTSLSHSADCLPGLHASTCDDTSTVTFSSFTALQWLSDNSTHGAAEAGSIRILWENPINALFTLSSFQFISFGVPRPRRVLLSEQLWK